MAFPVVEDRVRGSRASNATTTTIPMPATVNAGDLLIVLFATDGSTGHGQNNALAQSFTQLLNESNSTTVRISVWFKWADGSEDGQDAIFTSGSEMAAWHVYRISGASPAMPPFVGPTAQATSTSPNAPNCVTPWGSADNLWLTFVALDDNDTGTVGYPSGYDTNGIFDKADDNAGCELGSSYRTATAASEDAGAWTTANQQWKAATICVAPADAAVVPMLKAVASATSATVAKPTGTVEGDVMLAFVARFNSNTPPSAPSGWTVITSGAHGNTTAAFAVMGKVAGASEGSNYTFTNAEEGTIITFHGSTVDDADPFGPGSTNSGNSATLTGTGITTEVDNALLLLYATWQNTPSTPSGMSAIAGFPTASGAWQERIASAGATGNRTASMSSGLWHAQMTALNPAVLAPPPSAQPRFFAQLIG